MEKVVVSTSVVTYNSEGVICDVLDSITSSNTTYEVQTYVVDNCSSDRTVAIVEKNYPDVILNKKAKNLGYGAGPNIAIKASNAKYHIIINSDITFGKDFIQRAIDYMEAHPDVVMFNPDIRDVNRKRKYPVKEVPRLRYVIPRVIKCNNLMVCRKSALDAVGGFDERYFLYYEDLDLSMMMKTQGKIQCNPNVSGSTCWRKSGTPFQNSQKIHDRFAESYLFQMGMEAVI